MFLYSVIANWYFFILQPANLQLGGGVGHGGHNSMGVGPQMGGPMGPPDMGTPQKDLKFQMGMGNMMVSYYIGLKDNGLQNKTHSSCTLVRNDLRMAL